MSNTVFLVRPIAVCMSLGYGVKSINPWRELTVLFIPRTRKVPKYFVFEGFNCSDYIYFNALFHFQL